MKRILMILLTMPFLFSCVDPICREYEATVYLKNIDISNYFCYAYLKDTNEKLIVWSNLNESNNFSYTDKPWHMGNQIDLRNPYKDYGYESLQKTLDQIALGGEYIICEGDPQNLITKYTIECTTEDVKDITENKLYRCYEITLDWNKRKPISE